VVILESNLNLKIMKQQAIIIGGTTGMGKATPNDDRSFPFLRTLYFEKATNESAKQTPLEYAEYTAIPQGFKGEMKLLQALNNTICK
jgi:hypothetical protein